MHLTVTRYFCQPLLLLSQKVHSHNEIDFGTKIAFSS